MNKEIKQIAVSAPSVGYDSPSVRVVDVKMKHSILSASKNEFNTNPGEMGGDGGNVF